jgi:RHS repeat-associated protein
VVSPVPQSVYQQSRTLLPDARTPLAGEHGAGSPINADSLQKVLSDAQTVSARLNHLDAATRNAVLSALRSISGQNPTTLPDVRGLLADRLGAGASLDAASLENVLSEARTISARLSNLDATTRNALMTTLESFSGQSGTPSPENKMLLAGRIRTGAPVNVASLGNALSGVRTEIAGMKSQGLSSSDAASFSAQSLDGQSQTLLPDGSLLLVGGQASNVTVNTVFFQNVQSGSRTEASGAILHARSFHSATLLPSGSVLIFGGVAEGSLPLAQTELFDPVKQSSADISTTGLTPRAHHTATLLTDGRVLIAGGLDGQGNALRRIELWDYRTGQSTILAVGLKTPRSNQAATLLPDGNVLLWGGQDQNGSPLNLGEIIDPNVPSARLVSRLTESLQDSVPPRLAASIPQSGETGLPIDQFISLRFSKPLAVTSLNANTITLRTSTESIAIQVVPAEGGRLAFVTPQDSLQNGTAYTLSISGAADNSGQILPDTTVLFTTVQGTANVAAGAQASSTGTGSTGLAAVGTVATPSGLTSEWRNLPMLQAEKGVTALAGQVLTLDGSPLPNVLIEIDSQQATTDKTGRFLVENTGAGHHMMIVDGAPASTKTNTYGLYRIGVDLKAGVTNSLNFTVWETALDTEHAVTIPSPTTSEVIVTNPNVPGLELHIPAGTIIHDARGKVVTQVGITAVSTIQPPYPIKRGLVFPIYFTIQPGGATFANAGGAWSADGSRRGKGATIHYPNYMKGSPGARYQFWNYDPTQRGWYTYGNGRVSSDAKKIVPEEGTQIFSFDGASASTGLAALMAAMFTLVGQILTLINEPVDLQTGLFDYTQTDLTLQDVIPLVLKRSYRQGDYISRDFGVGMNMDYDIFLVGDDNSNPEGFTYQDLILANGARVHFTRTSPCTGANGFCQEQGAAYTATSTPTDYYGATINLVPSLGSWVLTKKDGTVYQFPAPYGGTTARQFALSGMQDRNGNSLTFTRDVNSNLTLITSPNGRWIQFTYDSSNRITGAQDNIGRTTSYTYDPVTGCMASATDANGGTTYYTYDPDGDMLSIKNPNGYVYLQNQYDVNGRVNLQTMYDGTTYSTYKYAYTLDVNGNVTQASATDERGYIHTQTYNSDGYLATDTLAVGKPEQQTVTYNRQQGTGILLSMTDSLVPPRTTTYSYDAMGNTTSTTQLAGTSNAATTTKAYGAPFNQVSSTTDPLGNTTTFAYDGNGNMIGVTDPLGDTTALAYNSAGQPTSITDALGSQTQLTYSLGNLVGTTDPLGRASTMFVDGAGRIAATTDPLGHTSRIAYNALGKIASTTDPLGNQTAFAYDADGNLLSVTDANQHQTSFTYDGLDRQLTRTDPLKNQESKQYDLSGDLIQATDRKGQVTTYQYDGLNRKTFAGYGTTAGPTYQSTTSYTYDAGNRLTGITDSITGTITRGYDGLDNLTSETTPQGTVNYTYDADKRKQTMTPSGQAQITYSYDNASRLTSIVQGASTVSFGYDSNGRRTSMTLPNGVVATLSYDAASQLTQMVYQGGSQGTQNLIYTYDLAGRRVGVSGSLASTQLPAAVSSAAYNANNQLTQWGSTPMTYDANGSTLTDGMNSYVWDARNRLASADNNAAAFAYDPLGRRVSKTFLSTTTNFLYDGANAVQEFGTNPTANLLTGGVDERFQRTSSTETDNYLTDALGSTLELTDASGATEEQYSYSPYGSQSASGMTTTNSYTYTGRESDGLGVDYYRARYYNPNTGRFLSEDPLGFAGSGMNLYAYASENPLRFNDPWGMCIATLNKAAQFVSNCMSSAATPVWDAAWMGGLAILVRALTLAILEITATEFVVPTLGLWGLLFYGLVVSFISEEALMLLAAVIGIAAIWYMCR